MLVGERGAYRLATALPAVQVPATVQAVVTARIDRLPPEEKRLLQTAVVIGTEVPLALLQAIAEVSDEALRVDLAHLQAAEFLYETRLFPDLEYTFKHALTHEVAYGSLLQERRRTLHARIVGALEGLAGDRLTEQVERLAYHALWGEVWDKAVAYSRQAGAKALARSAYREALTAFEQALTALQHLPDSQDTLAQAIDLRFDLRLALQPLGEYERIFDYLRDAETLAEALGDQRRMGQAAAHLINYFWYAVTTPVPLRLARAPVPLPWRLENWHSRWRRTTASPRCTTPWATIGRPSTSCSGTWPRSPASCAMSGLEGPTCPPCTPGAG